MDGVALILERVTNLLRSELREAALPFGLQPVHFSALLYLAQANRYSDTPAGVTAFLGATKGTVSQSLRILENHGLLKRRPDAEDRRVTHLELTPAGRQVIAQAWPPQRVHDATAAMSAADRRRLEQGLLAFLTAIQQTSGGRSFGVCSTCKLFEREGAGYRCGLTQEPLDPPQTEKICREHEPRTAA